MQPQERTKPAETQRTNAPPSSTAKEPERFFDYVVIVGLQDSGGTPTAPTNQKTDKPAFHISPVVKYRFPEKTSADAFMKSIAEFCFPDLSRNSLRDIARGDTFSFVLTEISGEKRWGYCRRMISASSTPLCFCIISFIPCFTVFSRILDEVIKRTPTGTDFEDCALFLDAIYKQPLPPPGETLTVKAPTTSKEGGVIQSFSYHRPDDADSLLDHVNFEPMLRHLEPPTIIKTFLSLIIERRVLFVADKLSTLSACVHALMAVLYPFSWQHIWIPVLPRSMLAFCCAPMPFVVGILRNFIPELKTLSEGMDEIVIVDIDNDQFICPDSINDSKLIPPTAIGYLAETLEHACKEVKSKYSLWNNLSIITGRKRSGSGHKTPFEAQDLANAFIGFMVDILGPYRNFIRGDKFQKDEFIAEQPVEVRPLLELVTQTQMFEVFLRDRMSRSGGKFENQVTLRRGKLPLLGSPRQQQTAESTVPKANARSRFTMYENGDISKEDITKKTAKKEKKCTEVITNSSYKVRDMLQQEQAPNVPESGLKTEGERSTHEKGSMTLLLSKLLLKGDEGASDKGEDTICISNPDYSSFRKITPEQPGVPENSRPVCPYGTLCRNRDPKHWILLQHTPSGQLQQTSTPGTLLTPTITNVSNKSIPAITPQKETKEPPKEKDTGGLGWLTRWLGLEEEPQADTIEIGAPDISSFKKLTSAEDINKHLAQHKSEQALEPVRPPVASQWVKAKRTSQSQ